MSNKKCGESSMSLSLEKDFNVDGFLENSLKSIGSHLKALLSNDKKNVVKAEGPVCQYCLKRT